jgi:hypothetical protein
MNLWTADLDALSKKSDARGNLLLRRLTEFGLSQEALKIRHPEVLHDLQRVCGYCDSTGRCASEFKRAGSAAIRSDYCPNTQTLEALKEEDRQSGADPSARGPLLC